MREALINRQNSLLRTRQRNQISRRFFKAYETIFKENIFPQGATFGTNDSHFYVSQREWLADNYERPVGDLPYEHLLDDLFWNQHHIQAVFIVGEVGIGKSTLVDFYLRAFCPSKHRDLWNRKLIVNVDLRNVSTPSEFDEVFYREFRTAVTNRLKIRSHQFDLISADNYAMWDGMYDWQSSHHTEMRASSGKSEREYRGDLVNHALAAIDDKTWVTYALQYLSLKIEEECAKHPNEETPDGAESILPFSFVILCLDNLDQSPFDVHAHAIAAIRKWLAPNSQIRLWQFYIPLRPETFSVIENQVEPLPMHHVVQVGRPNIDRILEARTQLAVKDIRDDPSWMGGTGKDPPGLTSEHCQMFMTRIFGLARPAFVKLVEQLSGGNLRRFLRLWETAMASVSLQHSFEKTDFMGIPRVHVIGSYALCDALLTGHYAVHHRIDSMIANVFYCVRDIETPSDALVGIHVLSLLASGCSEIDEISGKLVPLGHSEAKIAECIEYYRSKECCQTYSLGGRRILDINERAVGAHQQLYLLPAYLDNMTMVTPVEARHRARIKQTNGYDNAMFIDRVESTMVFLKQIREDEEALLAMGSKNPVFESALEDLRLPRLSVKCALPYRDRLQELRSGGFLRSILPDKWEAVLSNDVFRFDDEPCQYLRVSH